VTGRSKDDWPIVYVLFHNDKLSEPSVNAKCLLYSFERAIQSLPPQKQEFVLVIDTKGFGYSNVPPMNIVSEMSEILAKHMPRRLGVVFVVNVSYVVHWVYDMVSIAMSEVTRNKFRFISSNKDDMRRIMGKPPPFFSAVTIPCILRLDIYPVFILTLTLTHNLPRPHPHSGEYIDVNLLSEDYGGRGPKVDNGFDVHDYLDSDPFLEQGTDKLYS